jgi:hypothetical protein
MVAANVAQKISHFCPLHIKLAGRKNPMHAFTDRRWDLRWWQVVVLALVLLLAFFPWSAVTWTKGPWSP